MIFLGNLNKITDTKYFIGFIHYKPFDSTNGMNMSEEALQTIGVLVENIPKLEVLKGKQAIMYWNPIEKKVFYEYEDVSVSTEEDQKETVDQEKVAMAEAIVDLNNEIEKLKQEINILKGGK